MSKINNKKRGSLFKVKQDFTGTVILGPQRNAVIRIPIQTICLVLVSRILTPTRRRGKKPGKFICVRILLDTSIIEAQYIPKGRFGEYFERVKF